MSSQGIPSSPASRRDWLSQAPPLLPMTRKRFPAGSKQWRRPAFAELLLDLKVGAMRLSWARALPLRLWGGCGAPKVRGVTGIERVRREGGEHRVTWGEKGMEGMGATWGGREGDMGGWRRRRDAEQRGSQREEKGMGKVGRG